MSSLGKSMERDNRLTVTGAGGRGKWGMAADGVSFEVVNMFWY